MADPDLLIPAGLVDPATVAAYDFAPMVKFLANVEIYLFITPGSGGSAGKGAINFQRQ
jgi:hypothetical protein